MFFHRPLQSIITESYMTQHKYGLPI